jgi:hypothetical protein
MLRDRHAKKVVVTVVVVYLAFLCVWLYLTLLAPEDLRLSALRLRNSDNPEWRKHLVVDSQLLAPKKALPAF